MLLVIIVAVSIKHTRTHTHTHTHTHKEKTDRDPVSIVCTRIRFVISDTCFLLYEKDEKKKKACCAFLEALLATLRRYHELLSGGIFISSIIHFLFFGFSLCPFCSSLIKQFFFSLFTPVIAVLVLTESFVLRSFFVLLCLALARDSKAVCLFCYSNNVIHTHTHTLTDSQ